MYVPRRFKSPSQDSVIEFINKYGKKYRTYVEEAVELAREAESTKINLKTFEQVNKDTVVIDKNLFEYTFMGLAFDADGNPVYIAKVSGHTEIFDDCQYQYVTATMEVFMPLVSPFDGVPIDTIDLGHFYGYRASVDLPY